MKRKRVWTAAAGLLALAGGAATLPADPVVHMVAPCFGCATVAALLAGWPKTRGLTPAASIATAAVSLAVTGLIRSQTVEAGGEPQSPTALWILLELAVLALLTYLPVRWSPLPTAISGGTAALAVALMAQRFDLGSSIWAQLAAGAAWASIAAAVGLTAWYLRSLESRREHAVSQARRRQRMELAGDLHDFIAHDVSVIVAQAQAARAVLGSESPRTLEVLERIEAAGLRALTSMDRTVHMLRNTAEPARSPISGLADVEELTRRFAAAGSAEVDFVVEPPDLLAGREAGAVAYRVVAEALTNVRRHAHSASRVEVALRREGDCLLVTVVDDGREGPAAESRASAGLGLPGLAARVEALGGDLEAGPRPPRGWVLTARLPLDAAEIT
ncbi:MAG: sensor histidine kinase [Stackebrandtia sp.]